MTVRSKIWLTAVLITTVVSVVSWIRLQVTQSQVRIEAGTAAEELARDLVADLRTIEDPDTLEIEQRIVAQLNRYTRINRLEVTIVDLDPHNAGGKRIVVPRGERSDITMLNPHERRSVTQFRVPEFHAETITIYMPFVPNGPWSGTLSLVYSLGSVEEVLRTEERVSLVFGLGLVVLLTLFSGLLTQRIIGRPLEQLAGAMRDVEAGNLNRRVSVDSKDEVGRLSLGFNQMIARLGQADAEIRAFNQRLAREIDEATAALSVKNAALEQLNRLLDDMRRENASKVRLAALGELAAQLAHEIGTPLSSISGHVQLALMQSEVSPALRERLEVVRREGERISRIVRAYLDSTRPTEPERRPTALRKVIEEAVELSRGVDPKERAAVAIDVHADVQEVTTDPGLLRQILINLVANALDAVGPDGTIRVNAMPKGDDDVIIAVADTGQGIAPDDLRRIFEPFYTTKGRGKGTGLGLAISRQLTASLGGTISVQSKHGVGSTFFVKLPRRGAPVRLPDRAAE